MHFDYYHPRKSSETALQRVVLSTEKSPSSKGSTNALHTKGVFNNPFIEAMSNKAENHQTWMAKTPRLATGDHVAGVKRMAEVNKGCVQVGILPLLQ